jgi:hypothetical protein
MALPGIKGRVFARNVASQAPVEDAVDQAVAEIVAEVLSDKNLDLHALDTADITVEAKKPIPEGWQELPWNELRALAAGLYDDDAPIKNKADAIARIDAYLAS